MTAHVCSELKRMEDLEIICKVDQRTNWCAGMVVVPKTNGSVRICGDFIRLNEYVRRERHFLPSIEHLLASIPGAKYFSKLDAKSDFNEITLDENSQLLTVFITPLGQFCYCRLPFGISSAREYSQKRMSEVLDGLQGVICMMDDVLIFGNSQQERNFHLRTGLEKIASSGLTLNKAKCQINRTSIHFCGYIIDSTGVRPDPVKTEAVTKMPVCKNVGDVRRFLGMANQLGRFTPNLAELSQPLRELLHKNRAWCWDSAQQQALDSIKKELSCPPVLALYDPNSKTCVSADASSFGLGAVISQKQANQQWRPIACQSRSMTPTEQQYAQIEKEELAVTWLVSTSTTTSGERNFASRLTISR